MFWKIFRKKPAPKPSPKPEPKPEPERKVTPVPIGDVCKNAEGFFTGVGHPTNMACVKIPLNWPYFNGYTVIPDGMYPVIRVDGHCFHTFTRKLKKPFDPAMVKAMQSATKRLIEFFSACYGYTQSDEITVVLPKDSQDFGRKTHKLASLAASIATSEFIRCMEQCQDRKLSRLPAFDGRAFAMPDDTMLAYYQLWRQQDSIMNAISSVARAYFSHKQLDGKNSDEKVEMLRGKGVDFWNDYSTAQIVGFYFKRKLVTRKFTTAEISRLPEHHDARKNPDLEIVRSEISRVDFAIEVKPGLIDGQDVESQIISLIAKELPVSAGGK